MKTDSNIVHFVSSLTYTHIVTRNLLNALATDYSHTHKAVSDKEDVQIFTQGNLQSDDITMIVIKVK